MFVIIEIMITCCNNSSIVSFIVRDSIDGDRGCIVDLFYGCNYFMVAIKTLS